MTPQPFKQGEYERAVNLAIKCHREGETNVAEFRNDLAALRILFNRVPGTINEAQ